MWFEFGGRRIGRMSLDIVAIKKAKERQQHMGEVDSEEEHAIQQELTWRLKGRYRSNFSPHHIIVFVSQEEGIYLIGGNGNNQSNLHYNWKTIATKENLPQEKTFFSAVYHKGIIYTFGGYDAYDKVQLNTCEYYDTKKDKWFNSPVLNPKGQVEF